MATPTMEIIYALIEQVGNVRLTFCECPAQHVVTVISRPLWKLCMDLISQPRDLSPDPEWVKTVNLHFIFAGKTHIEESSDMWSFSFYQPPLDEAA